jgi:hypothetical protein
MKQFKLVDNVLGWLSFLIAAFVYCSTIEPTASFWDCPEFITTGYKMEIGHPPGAPFFMLTAVVKISLNSIDKVKSFVNDITKFDYDFDLVSGRYVIDAKSIMGIFSLDLSKPIDLNIHAEDNIDEVLAVLKPYMV